MLICRKAFEIRKIMRNYPTSSPQKNLGKNGRNCELSHTKSNVKGGIILMKVKKVKATFEMGRTLEQSLVLVNVGM
jgi:hypothetical protein